MNHDELTMLFTALHGYWPGTAPDIDNAIDVHAYGDLLRNVALDAALDAARALALEGREFCPPAGVLAKRAHPIVPPERVDYVEEIPRSTAKEIPLGSQVDGDGWVDLEGFCYDADGNLDVQRLLADMKRKLTGKPGARFLGAALRAIPQP